MLEPRAAVRGRTGIAWIAIACAVAWVVSSARTEQERVDPNRPDALLGFEQKLMTQFGLALHDLAPESPEHLVAENLERLGRGPIPNRLQASVILAEFNGPQAALDALVAIEALARERGVEPAPEWDECSAALEELYRARSSGRSLDGGLAPEVREQLVARLGWFGTLALSHADVASGSVAAADRARLVAEATRLALIIAAGLAAAALYFLGGCAALLVFVLTLGSRRRGDSPEPPAPPHGGVYAETFAIWLVGTIASQTLSAPLLADASLETKLISLLFLSFASLSVLAWPVLRGIPWEVMRNDIGLRLRRPLVDAPAGILCHAAVLPVLLALMIATMLGAAQLDPTLLDPGQAPGEEVFRGSPASHPIVGMAGGSAPTRWLIVLLAVVAAPIVEEIVFRGLLYSQLRASTHSAGRLGSGIASGAISGLVFAVIHPQGWLAVPVLAGLGAAFAAAREWRGSLLPSICAHAFHNGVLVAVMLLVA